MSMGTACKCRPRNLVVLTRRGNYSAFSGYHFTPSDYSDVRCLTCGQRWRTKAEYVNSFPDDPKDERWQWPEQERSEPLGSRSRVCMVNSLGSHEPRSDDPARCRHCGFFIPEMPEICGGTDNQGERSDG